MADFCKECSIGMFGVDFRELAGLSDARDTKLGRYAPALCEGCGPILVDHEGKRVSEPIPPDAL